MKTHFAPNYFLNPTHPIHICLIGVGGTGSFVLTRLARIHYALVQLGHPGLFVSAFDNDKVEPFNVGRQNFTPADVYENKAFALVSKINTAFGLNWKAYKENYNTNISNPYSANIFVTCVDNAPFRERFNAFFINGKTQHSEFERPYYWLDMGNSRKSGQIVLGSKTISQPETQKFQTLDKLPTIIEKYGNLNQFDTIELQGQSCSYLSKLNEQSLFINDALSVYASDLLLELIHKGYISQQGIFINMDNFKANPILLN